MHKSENRKGPSDIDWDECHRRIRDSIRAQQLSDPEAVNDLAQVAIIRLFRLAHREGVQNLEAIRQRIAHGVVVEFFRHKRVVERAHKLLVDHGADAAPSTDVLDAYLDGVRTVRMLVLEYFRQDLGNHQCAELAHAYFEGRTWEEIAAEQDEKVATIRKRWQRCLDRLRQQAEDWPEISNLRDSLER